MERIRPGAPGKIRSHYRFQVFNAIDILDVVGDIAVIRITLEHYHGADYVDFYTLKKDESGWKIMAKVFTEA